MISNKLNPEILKARSDMYRMIRDFFLELNYLEVESPLMSKFATVDVNIDSFKVNSDHEPFYLTTSPEFHMKRLLIEYKRSIFQICKAFRMEEQGPMHNPEFTILEWYKIDADEFALMKEIELFLLSVLKKLDFTYLTYTDVFKKYTGIDPVDATILELNDFCMKKEFSSNKRDELIDFIWIDSIEPKLNEYQALFIYDYPSTQSALAKLKEDDKKYSRRFELFIEGVEVANGFNELQDSKEQEIRFIIDQQKRESKRKRQYPYDKNLILAMELGLPQCSGVAFGLDRLLMLKLGKDDIKDVIPFTIEIA